MLRAGANKDPLDSWLAVAQVFYNVDWVMALAFSICLRNALSTSKVTNYYKILEAEKRSRSP